MRTARIAAGFTALALAVSSMAQEPAPPTDPALFDAGGYRAARYRSPVKADPRPAAPIALAAVLEMEPGRDALFIDVMPAEGGVRDPASGRWALANDHLTIPGALWFPETGRAQVDGDLWRALETAVRDARRASPGQPVILFCRIDCWMSWNAARRLALRGIGNVHWFAEGTDGWHAAGRALAVAVPVTTPSSTRPQGQNEGK